MSNNIVNKTIRINKYPNTWNMPYDHFVEYFNDEEKIEGYDNEDFIEVHWDFIPSSYESELYYSIRWKAKIIDNGLNYVWKGRKLNINGSSYFALASCSWEDEE